MSTLKLNQSDFKKRKYKYSLYCSNCGKSNHLFSQCHNPITSYGICCFLNPSTFIDINNIYKNDKNSLSKNTANNTANTNFSYANITSKNISRQENIDTHYEINQKNQSHTTWKNIKDCVMDSIKLKDGNHRNNEYRMLMINRNYSVAFMEFIRGKYDVENETYIYTLFEKMTLREINIICSNSDFTEIRKKMNFYNNNNKKFKHEYDTAKLKFNYISKLGILSNILNKLNFKYHTKFELGKYIGPPPGLGNEKEYYDDLYNQLACENTHTLYKSPEWLFPKGKREDKETDLKTALREFYEETGIHYKYLNVFKNIIPIELNFVGVNGIEYRNIYFIAELASIPKNIKFKYNTETFEIDVSINSQNKELVKEVSDIKLLSMTQCLDKCRDYECELRELINCAFNFYINFKKFFAL
jgi:8-oxo-dGTP pyrophosphatase MutT (NUDIX family)